MTARLPLADIKFIADFATFARSKGDEAYEYTDNLNCAACQFLRHTGRAVEPSVAGDRWTDLSSYSAGEFAVWGFLPALDAPALRVRPNTFPALADRLEALIVDAPVVTAA